MIGWSFPLNNYGQETGLNDAGIETFRGNPWDSLAREIIQNSLDAKQKNTVSPVEVHFGVYYLSKDQFPHYNNFNGVLESCKTYWRSNTKTRKFFDNSLELMCGSTIPMLKISDYNTTGLTGSSEERGTNWHNLIKSVGVSDKDGPAGGSFGIGKAAPFACSQIRTVFYGTKDCEGQCAFQGVAKLVTHNNSDNKPTQGTGYYGITERNLPILDYTEVNEFFHRNKVGTDIFVAGFNDTDGWKEKIIKSVLENFFIAILHNQLIVRVEDVDINSNTLPDLIESYIETDAEGLLSGKYYKAMISEHAYSFSEVDFEGFGQIELYILQGQNYPKRVAMVRGTGMKIFDKGHFQTPMKFVGVLIAKGDKMNEFLRSLEPPSHNNWEPERHDDPKYAKKILNKLKSWVNEKVRSIAHRDDAEELEIAGMSQFLPDDFGDAIPLIDNNGQVIGEKVVPLEVDVKNIYREPITSTVETIEETAAAEEYDDGADGSEGGDSNESEGGSSTSGGGSGGSSSEGGDNESATSSNDSGRGSATDKPGEKPVRTSKPLSIKRTRVFCVDADAGVYNVTMVSKNDGEGYISLNIVGEVGADKAPIKSAVIKGTDEELTVKAGRIGPITFIANAKTTVLVSLSEPIRCALEVATYAN